MAAPAALAGPPAGGSVQPGDWPTYGAGAHHTFNNATGLTTANVHTLAP